MISDRKGLCFSNALTVLERLPANAVTLVYLDPAWPSASDGEADRQDAEFLSRITQQIHRVLQENGSLFLHSPNRPGLDLRLIVNQTFGKTPFYEITWRLKHSHFATQGPRRETETLLVYSRSDKPIYNPVYRRASGDELAAFSNSDERGPYRQADLTSPIGRSTSQKAWRNYEPPASRSWRFSIEMLERLAEENRIVFPPSGGAPKLKQYLDEQKGIDIGTVWTDISPVVTSKSERVGFPTQKPLVLLERVITLASNEGDTVLDPFFGSGTTFVAAHSLGRRWLGADTSEEAQQITQQRLADHCDLQAGRDYLIYQDHDVLQHPVQETAYREIVTSVQEIATLQQDVRQLTERLLSLKRLMNFGETESDERVEDFIAQMEHWISQSIAQQRKPLENYIAQVKSWLIGWEHLAKESQTFLSEGELLFEYILETSSEDYSPFVLQYCRALENELLTKLFAAFTDSFPGRHPDVADFLAADLADKKTFKFASFLSAGKKTYTLGDMAFIMSLLKEGGSTWQRSPLLADFREFALNHFNEHIVDRTYLDQINKINDDFRKKAAHPYILDARVAELCRASLRECLNSFILNYQPPKVSGDADEG